MDIQFTGMADAFVQTVRKNGILGLWSGTSANLAKVRPFLDARTVVTFHLPF